MVELIYRPMMKARRHQELIRRREGREGWNIGILRQTVDRVVARGNKGTKAELGGVMRNTIRNEGAEYRMRTGIESWRIGRLDDS